MNFVNITGRINSIQSLGTLDGPGVRFVVFMQGCNLRCGCCHNPDTWSLNDGYILTAQELAQQAIRYKSYFGSEGGITVSGGEPLLQAEFVTELFRICRMNRINTCLDTSGSIINDSIKTLLSYTDRVLLDIKYTNDADYIRYVGCSINRPLNFLYHLNKIKIPVTLRQVIIPTLNDNDDNIRKLRDIIKSYPCIDKAELLPFKKICKVKYDNMNLEFDFDKFSTPEKGKMDSLSRQLNI